MAINFGKFAQDLKREFKSAANQALQDINRQDRVEIGNAVIEEIKTIVGKGVSPIATKGRFDAYKWVGKANQLLKVGRTFKNKERRARARQKAAEIKKGKYPYSVQKKFPNKRERPVNLTLSGEFLSDLKTKPTLNGLEVGFYTDLSVKKEEGHRIGVNGQPRRPIIPQGDEEFSPSIYRRIVDSVLAIVRRKFKT